MAKDQPQTLEEMERLVAKWAEEHPEELERTRQAARRASEQCLKDAKVTPEQMRRPVDF